MTKPRKSKDAVDAVPPDHPVWKQWPKAMLRPLSSINPYPDNPRTHPPAQIAMLAALMREHGPDQPIVMDDDDDFILKGHGRRLAAFAAGFKFFPVVGRTGLSAAEKTAMRISDNQVNLLSDWDKELVRSQVGTLRAAGYDVKLLGFGDTQLVQFETLPGPPAGFQTYDENISTAYHCPCGCDYRWSGNPLAGADAAEVKKAKKKK